MELCFKIYILLIFLVYLKCNNRVRLSLQWKTKNSPCCLCRTYISTIFIRGNFIIIKDMLFSSGLNHALCINICTDISPISRWSKPPHLYGRHIFLTNMGCMGQSNGCLHEVGPPTYDFHHCGVYTEGSLCRSLQ